MLRSLLSMALDASVRVLTLLLGLAGALWCAMLLPQFASAIPTKDVTTRIVADEHFRIGTLSDLLMSLQASPELFFRRSDLPRSLALIQLVVAQDASTRKSADEADGDVIAADQSLRLSLSLNPTDSFLWLMLYSVEATRSGFDIKSLRLLDESYATGPREGWIALRRNKLSLSVFPMVSEGLQAEIVSEFAGMVDSDFTEVAALNLTGNGWAQRDRLLAGLAHANIIAREAFAKRLARDGVSVIVPGVEFDERLWR